MNGFYIILSGLGTQQGEASSLFSQNDMLSSYTLVLTMFFYPDAISILSRFYPNFIQILARVSRNSHYPSLVKSGKIWIQSG